MLNPLSQTTIMGILIDSRLKCEIYRQTVIEKLNLYFLFLINYKKYRINKISYAPFHSVKLCMDFYLK